jgi:hypothetical protein
VDSVSKFLIAITATGSAVAGWALWEKPGFKEIWIIIAGLAALMTIVQSTFRVPERVKQWADVGNKFGNLRNTLEGLQQRIKMNPQHPFEEYIKEYSGLRDEFNKEDDAIPNDLLVNKRRSGKIQRELNRKLGINT